MNITMAIKLQIHFSPSYSSTSFQSKYEYCKIKEITFIVSNIKSNKKGVPSMQLKTYTWKSYTFLIVSIFVTINLFLFTPILDRVGIEYVVPFAYFILASAVIAILLAIISFVAEMRRKF